MYMTGLGGQTTTGRYDTPRNLNFYSKISEEDTGLFKSVSRRTIPESITNTRLTIRTSSIMT